MNKFFDIIDKYKFAIMGTVLFHVGLFLYANFVTVKRPYNIQEDIMDVSMPLDEIALDEEMMKLLNMPDPANVANEKVYNVASDANDTREKSYENFSTQDLDEQVNSELQNLENEYKDFWVNQRGGDQQSSSGMDLREEKDNSNPTKNQNQNPKGLDNGGDKAFAGSVMASFDLKNRKALELPKPGYTCNRAGTVVLAIKVDKNGTLKSVEYLADRSSGADECMIEQAIKYAKRARFNYSESAPAIQEGTITYKFVGG